MTAPAARQHHRRHRHRRLHRLPGQAGKTGTTDNYTDAWFAGYQPNLATVVWVGYPQSNAIEMTSVHGITVFGGTFPAEIWHSLYSGAGSPLRGIQQAARSRSAGRRSTAVHAAGRRRLLGQGLRAEDGEEAEAERLGEEATGGYDPDAYAPGAGQEPTPVPPPPPAYGPASGRRRRERIAEPRPGRPTPSCGSASAPTSACSAGAAARARGSSGPRSSSSSSPSRSPRRSSPTTSTATSTTPASASSTASTPTSTRRRRSRRPRLRPRHLDRHDQRLRAALHAGDLPARPGSRCRRASRR